MHLVEEFSNRKIETFATDESVTHDTESVLHNNVCVSELLLNIRTWKKIQELSILTTPSHQI